jgi:hypothetical protein
MIAAAMTAAYHTASIGTGKAAALAEAVSEASKMLVINRIGLNRFAVIL